jgi:N-acetylmuramoyl-L-alanine amidase
MDFEVVQNRLVGGAARVRFVASPNVGGQLTPRFLIVHYTASGPNADVAAQFSQPAARVSSHLVIRRDGTVVQCVPFDRIAWHAGKSRWVDTGGRLHVGLNGCAIGIEMENWGPLSRSSGTWTSWTGTAVADDRVIEARHKFGSPDGGWERFTEAQSQAAVAAARAICAAYGITEILGHDDVSPGRKSDPGPAWNMLSYRASVLGRAERGDVVMAVRSPSGLNIRSGPGISHPAVASTPLPDGTRVLLHELHGRWCFASVLDEIGQPYLSGWVHGAFLFDVA